jgi:hypothetical protein
LYLYHHTIEIQNSFKIHNTHEHFAKPVALLMMYTQMPYSRFQLAKLHGNEKIIYSCMSDVDDEADGIDVDVEHLAAVENGLRSAFPDDASWLELDDSEPFRSQNNQRATARTIVPSHEFEVEIRQHVYDLLQYVDGLERQVR